MSRLKLASVFAAAVLVILAGGSAALAQDQDKPCSMTEKDALQSMEKMKELHAQMQEMSEKLESGEQISAEQMQKMMQAMLKHQLMMTNTMHMSGTKQMKCGMEHKRMMTDRSGKCPMMKGKGAVASSKMQCAAKPCKGDQEEKPSESGPEVHKH